MPSSATTDPTTGTTTISSDGAGTTEYANVQMANLINYIGTACGTLIALIPPIMGVLPANSKYSTICGALLAVCTNLAALLVKLNYSNNRTAVKTALITASASSTGAGGDLGSKPANPITGFVPTVETTTTTTVPK